MTTRAPVAPLRVPETGLRQDLRCVKVVCQRELIRWGKDRGRLVSGLVQPVLWLFVMGAGLSTLMPTRSGVDFRTFLFPGIVATSVLFTGIFSGISIVWDREFGFLREMLVAPVSRGAILLGKCLGGAIVAGLQGLVMLAMAGFVHVPYHPLLMLELAGLIFLVSFSITALGLLMAARIKQVQSAMPMVQLLITPMMFLSGSMFPLGGLPPWLRVLTRINPLTYAVEPMRAAVFDHLNVDAATRQALDPGITWGDWQVPVSLQIALVVAMTGAMLWVAIRRFSRTD
jgi:ABC-2 type transport system permease protein